ncbi:MAG: hypothetical protein VB088_04725 [Sphaerochaeta sp.]|nr:hypothetical protein [Sphaerochaeta sp.]HBO36144.1 hypothetical protein [Sphaerochaeta sp.]
MIKSDFHHSIATDHCSGYSPQVGSRPPSPVVSSVHPHQGAWGYSLLLGIALYQRVPSKEAPLSRIGEYALDDRMGDESGFPASASQPQPKPPSLF